MTRKDSTIGYVARKTGCKVQTIRYYEQIGLLPRPARTEGNHRIYERSHIERVSFIRHSRELGFSLDHVRRLLRLNDDLAHSCQDVDRIARENLLKVETRITQLSALKMELERMIQHCEGGQVADCRIIEVLADHSHAHCLSHDHSAAV